MSDYPLPDPMPEEVLDIQHDTDPAQDHGPARRIPHMGHTLLFFSLAATCIMFFQLVFMMAAHINTPESFAQHPGAAALGELLGYVATFAVAVPLFARLWGCGFLQGIHWVGRRARLHWWRLLLVGVCLAILAEFADRYVPTPTDSDIILLLRTPLSAWITAIVGSFFAPLVEEIGFRGFLLPSLATAYDWFSLERTPAGLQRWEQTTGHTSNALLFGAMFSSIAFALLHGMQLHWSKGPLAVLFVVSLAFAGVRIVTKSVAASTLVHMAYDAFIFAGIIITTHGFRHFDQLK